MSPFKENYIEEQCIESMPVPIKNSIRGFEDDIQECDKILRENHREMDMIESDLG